MRALYKINAAKSSVLCDSAAVEVLPYLTADIAGTGGQLRVVDEDFVVIETPAYMPTGVGDHVMLHVEKRNLTTPQAAAAIARGLGVAERDVGWAGMKDRRAVAQQWFSAPPPTTPEQALALQLPDLQVIAAARHPNKLKTGHVASNHFRLRVRNCSISPAAALQAAHTVLARMAQGQGALNWYGEQRFGRTGDNAQRGRELLLGARSPARHPRGQKLDRLMLSALQSELFNQWLLRRLNDGLFNRALRGDIMRKRSGGMFVCEDADADQARVESGEIVVTGPMFGTEMRRPPEGSLARIREDGILADAELPLEAFAAHRRLASGTRREQAIAVQTPQAGLLDGDLVVEFGLSAGGYATAIMREVMKVTPLDAPRAVEPLGSSDDAAVAPLDFAESVEQ
jgi:tRNA pseudouridine13 synthase